MQRVTKLVLVPYPAAAMYDLVDRVEDYPGFLPWCSGVDVLEMRADGKTARIDINFHGVRAYFTTRNLNRPVKSIIVALEDGPFSELSGEWRFGSLADQACKVEFDLAYEFATPILEAAVGPVFRYIANTFVDAFVRRAESLHARKK